MYEQISMTNLERVRLAFQSCYEGDIFSWGEVLDRVRDKFPNDDFSMRSIIPSDYCYNLLNIGKINDRKLFDFNIFEYSSENRYVYLGENYPYNNNIYHRPRGGKPYRIGRWINGERVIAPEDDHGVKEVDNKEFENNKIPHKTTREPGLKLRYQVLQRDNFKCCACGASPAKDPSVELHIDHVIPWSKGGETVIENLQTLCSGCNLGKGNL